MLKMFTRREKPLLSHVSLMSPGEMSASRQATSGHFRVMAVYLSFVVFLLLLYVTGTQQAILPGMIYIQM